MTERVQVVIEAKDAASGVLRGITSQMGQLGAATEQLTGSSINWGNVAAAATRMVTDAVKDAYDVSTKYAASVRDLALASGTTAENASRLIQVLDDYEITAENITAATKKLTSQGLAPTIETIASLSDQYLELNTAQEKNAFITENLGRGGAKWANVLKEGSAAILEMNAGVAEGLILNDQQINQYEELRLELDELNDSLESIKVEFITENIVWLNNALFTLKELIKSDNESTWLQKLTTDSFTIIGAIDAVYDTYMISTGKMKDQSNKAAEAASASAALYWEQSYAVKASGQAAAIANIDYGKLLISARGLNDATKEQIRLAGYTALEQKMKESGGEITQEEAKALEKAGIMLGIFDQKAVDTANSVDTLSTAFAEGTIDIYAFVGALNSIPSSVGTTLTYTEFSVPNTSLQPAFNPGGTANGGFVSGPGDGTRDTFLQPMANGEFVVNARDAQRNAGLLKSINEGGGVDSSAANYFYGNVTFVGGDGGSSFMEQR